MKRFFLLLGGILLLNLNSLSAQKLFLGPELGVNLAPTIETGDSQNYQLGVNGGLRLVYDFNDKLSLKSGVYFTQKYQSFDSTSVGSILDVINGALGGFPGGGGGIDAEDLIDGLGVEGLNLDVIRRYEGTIRANFIEIPLEVQAKAGRVGFSLGGYAAYMISAKSNATVTENTPLLQVINIEDLLGEGAGGFGGLFNHGLRDYRLNRPADVEEKTNINENAFAPFKNITFTLGYQLGVKKKPDSVFMP